MKKIFITIFALTFAYSVKSQSTFKLVVEDGFAKNVNGTDTMWMQQISNVDQTFISGAIKVSVSGNGKTREFFTQNVSQLIVNGISIPVTATGIVYALIANKFVGGGSGSGGSGTSDASAANQVAANVLAQRALDSTMRNYYGDSIQMKKAYDSSYKYYTRLQKQTDTTIKRFDSLLVKNFVSSDSLFIKLNTQAIRDSSTKYLTTKIIDSLHKQIDTLSLAVTQLRLIKYYDSLNAVKTGALLDTTIQANADRRLRATDAGASNAQTQRTVESDDVPITGPATQTAIIANILSGTVSTATASYRSASTQIVSTGTGGTYIFEGSNDNANFQQIPVYVTNNTGSTALLNSAITATASGLIYRYPTYYNFVRLRIVTAITGGSIQAFTKFSRSPFTTPIMSVVQGTSANLNTTTSLVANSSIINNNGIPSQQNDVASAAITTTTTTAAFTPSTGVSYTVQLGVTAVTGTSPTLQINIEESFDGGTNWVVVHSFPTITAITPITLSAKLPNNGNRVRYVQTITGTTPSFTRSITRIQSNDDVNLAFRSRAISQTFTITTGGTSQVLAPFTFRRQGFEIQNLSTGDLYFNIGNTAGLNTSFKLVVGGSYSSPATRCSIESINIWGATTGQQFAFIEYK